MKNEKGGKSIGISRYPRVKLTSIAFSIFSIVGIFCLSSCDDTEKNNKTQATGTHSSALPSTQNSPTASITETNSGNSTTCPSGVDSDDFMESTHCEATKAFDALSQEENRNLSFDLYLKGYRTGINQARQARSKILKTKNPSYEEQKGHEDGYQSVLAVLGMNNNFSENDPNSQAQEFQQLQKEAKSAFNNSKLDTNNPFLEMAFINGYLSGGRTVLSMPTSMDGMNFLTGDNETGDPEKPDFVPPSQDAPDTIKAFYNGFISGTKAMEDSIKESFDRFMNQMQEAQEGENGTDIPSFDNQSINRQKGSK